MPRVRAFYCINPSPEVHARLVEFQEELRMKHPGLKWVRPENLHLTLRFLGSVEEQALVQMTARVAEVVADLPAFGVKATGVGFFPARSPYKVLWAGLHAPEVTELFRQVDYAVADLAPHRENKSYHPHLTLARIPPQYAYGADLEAVVKEHSERLFGSWRANEVVCMQSTLTPSGSHYTALTAIPMRGPNVVQ